MQTRIFFHDLIGGLHLRQTKILVNFVRSNKVFDEGSNKKWWIGTSYRDFNVCIQKKSRIYWICFSTNLELDIIMIMKQLKWTITFRRTFCYIGTFISDQFPCIFWTFGAFTWPKTKQRGYFDLFWSLRHICL